MTRKTEAFVLAKKNTSMKGSTSVVLLTKDFGKVEASVRGIGKTTSRSVGMYEIGRSVFVEFLEKKTFSPIVTSISLRGGVFPMFDNLDVLLGIWNMSEVCDIFLLPEGPKEDVFTLYQEYYDALSVTSKPQLVTLSCLLKFLQRMGFIHPDNYYPSDTHGYMRIPSFMLCDMIHHAEESVVCSMSQRKLFFLLSSWSFSEVEKLVVDADDVKFAFAVVQKAIGILAGRGLRSFALV